MAAGFGGGSAASEEGPASLGRAGRDAAGACCGPRLSVGWRTRLSGRLPLMGSISDAAAAAAAPARPSRCGFDGAPSMRAAAASALWARAPFVRDGERLCHTGGGGAGC